MFNHTMVYLFTLFSFLSTVVNINQVNINQSQPACKDVPRSDPSRVSLKIFAVLVARNNHVVLTLSFKLVLVW